MWTKVLIFQGANPIFDVGSLSYINMYTPDFDFNNPQYHNCVVDVRQMGVVLKNDEHCKMGMVELKQKLIQNLGLAIDEQEWIYSLDEFMKNIK